MRKTPISRDTILDKSIPMPYCGCWIWTDFISPTGYGRITFNHKGFAAHRVSYEVFVGKIPPGLCACHKCDTPACVNPDHIFIATQQENLEDCRRKGRSRFGIAETRKRMGGYFAANKKLNEAQVAQIWFDERTVKEIASFYGVSIHAIYEIRDRSTWRHVTKDFPSNPARGNRNKSYD